MLGKAISLIKKILFSPEKRARMAGVHLGLNNFVSCEFWSSEPYLITIGNNCQITNGVKFFTHGGGGAVRNIIPKFDCFGKIVVGDNVYFGNGSMIMPGVVIGNNVLIAAGSVVTKSIPSNVVVGGNPARILSSIEKYVEKNRLFNLNSKGMSFKEKRKLLLSMSDEMFIKKQFLE